MMEYRWTTFPQVFQLYSLGIAGFVEYGGAWYQGSPTRTGVDAGFGLRFGSLRATSLKGAARIDLAYRFGNSATPSGWTIVLGTGFPFEQVLSNLVSVR